MRPLIHNLRGFYYTEKSNNLLHLMLHLYTEPHTLFGSRWSGITTRNFDGTYYMSKLSRSFFCYLLNIRLKNVDPDFRLHVEGSIDLKTLALMHRDESLEILNLLERPHLEENNYVMDLLAHYLREDSRALARVVKQEFDRRYQELLLDG